jgi:hypothetical protein
MNSASLSGLAGGYDNPILTWFPIPHRFFKNISSDKNCEVIFCTVSHKFNKGEKQILPDEYGNG